MPWYAIRTVYHFMTKEDGTNVYEERIVSFKAQSWTEAHDLAKLEADRYAILVGVSLHSEQVGYEQEGDDLIQGYELWSELYESKENIETFYVNRYLKYKYTPEI